MRRFPAGVAIVAAGVLPHRAGLTATAICSLSTDPPQVLACLNRHTMTCRTVQQYRSFSVNLLHTSQLPLARVFAGLDGEAVGEEKFAAGAWSDGSSGVPVLSGSVLTLECTLVASYAASTHDIFIGKVMAVANPAAEDALLYRSGTFGRWADLAASPQFT